MANLQIKGVDEDFYRDLKRFAAAEHRTVSGTVLAALKEYLANKTGGNRGGAPKNALLALSGSWEDDRSAGEIVKEIRSSRRNSRRAGRI